jgi:hypothetical protein
MGSEEVEIVSRVPCRGDGVGTVSWSLIISVCSTEGPPVDDLAERIIERTYVWDD